MEIKLCNNNMSEIWDKEVMLSEYGTLFHTWKFLKTVENNSGSTLYPLMIYQGTELKAIYPFFITRKNGIKVALSPASKSNLFYMGPLIRNYESLKQRKRESIFINIQKSVDDYLFSELGCKYSRINLSPGIFDSRPLMWAGYNIDTLYTNRIDLNRDIEAIWNGMDKKIKSNIKKAYISGISIEKGNLEDMNYLLNSLADRMKSHGIYYNGKWDYFTDLYNTFKDENMNVYVAKLNNERIGGSIILYYKDIFCLWLGTYKNDDNSISANELIIWEGMKQAKKNGFSYFENIDTGKNLRLRLFKSRFNPEPVIWYSAEKYSSNTYKSIDACLRKIQQKL